MKRNKIYESLIDKSIGSMLSAIEIYNKPDFKYREEIFAILSINSWELLLKARLFQLDNYKIKSIYCYKPYVNKKGEKSSRKKVIDYNRTNNPKTISIYEALKRLEGRNELPHNLKMNIEALIDFRDSAIHFVNMRDLSKPLQELGFACIKNYVRVLEIWSKRSMSNYNLYLMPLAYVNNKRDVDSASSLEAQNFIKLVNKKLAEENKDEDYDITIRIDLKFQKGNSFGVSTSVKIDTNGIPITITEEDKKKKYPLTYKDVCKKAKQKYPNFKCDNIFHSLMKGIKQDENLCYERKLDPQNPKTPKQRFYSSNIWQKLDSHYQPKIRKSMT